MPSEPKTYIFTDQETNLVLSVKRSMRYDYLLGIPGVRSYLLCANEKFAVPSALRDVYDPSTGIKPAPDPVITDAITLRKRKVESAIFLRTACGILADEIRSSLSQAKIKESGFRGEVFRSYFLLVTEEKRIVLRRVRQFLHEMENKLAQSATLPDLEAEMRLFQENVNLGVYSTANQERKLISR